MIRNEIVDCTKKGGTEFLANVLALAVAMKMVGGKKLFRQHCKHKNL